MGITLQFHNGFDFFKHVEICMELDCNFFFFFLVCSWQPKLIINNIDVLRNASLSDDDTSVCGSMYHDSLVWRIIALGANERCLPVILVTSDR